MFGDDRLDHAYLDGRTVVPTTFDAWLKRLKESGPNARCTSIVKQDQVGDFFVSTVFLAMDHGFRGPPLWFETMVFAEPKAGELMGEEQLQWRYATYDEAEAGHAIAIEMAKTGNFADRAEGAPS